MSKRQISAIVVGGSFGALDALNVFLPRLPKDFPAPLAIALHLLPSRPSGLAELLRTSCALRVKEAEDKEPLLPGAVYLAPPNYHLMIEKERHCSLSVDDAVRYSRPSIDVLFDTAADAYGRELLGLLLSGANDDGARGLSSIRARGGLAAAQSPRTATARAMPEAALALGAAEFVLDPPELGPFLEAAVASGDLAPFTLAEESR